MSHTKENVWTSSIYNSKSLILFSIISQVVKLRETYINTNNSNKQTLQEWQPNTTNWLGLETNFSLKQWSIMDRFEGCFGLLD